MRSNLDLLCRALSLVDLGLLDARTSSLDQRTAFLLELEALGVRDEAAARQAVDRFLRSPPGLVDTVDWLGGELFEPRGGSLVLRTGTPLARRAIRVLDPDPLVSLSAELRIAADDGFDWPIVPLDDGGPIASLLCEGSWETHIHLGGALPPCFYWLLLMGGEVGYETLGWVRSTRRGHAPLEPWMRAVARAAWLRIALAARVETVAQARCEPCCFPHLQPIGEAAWKPFFSGAPPESLRPLEVRDLILRLTRPLRLRRRNPGEIRDWAFSEPLRRPPREGLRSHYAQGERCLLAAVGRLVREQVSAPRTEHRNGIDLAAWLREYLRTRNAFHGLMVYDHGSDGLLRFVEVFNRRGFVYGDGRARSEQRGRRVRRHVVALEQFRMSAALDAQLVEPFDSAFRGQRGGPLRSLEMRVSVPRGPSTPRVLRAWMRGIADHLRAPSPGIAGPSSRIGLVFHFIKAGGLDAARRAEEEARRLGHLLAGYPGLRPLVVGLDAAGDERAAPPRTFLQAFRAIRDLAGLHRAGLRARPIRLGFTYHAGEDMVDLLTGLRHMDEAASLLLPAGTGGRLGHALALADDPRRFYGSRGNQSEPPLGWHLLDLVWAWGRLSRTQHADGAQWLIQHILSLVEKPRIEVSAIAACFRAMDLDEPRRGELRSEPELLAELGFAGDPAQPALPPVDEAWIDLLRTLQKILQERFLRRRICIEANPTSNLIIGGFTSYEELPYPALVAAGLPVSINTDDPGLFMTSLPGELAALYEVLQKTMPHRQTLAWLADRTFDARHSTFLGAGMPITEATTEEDLDVLFRYRP